MVGDAVFTYAGPLNEGTWASYSLSRNVFQFVETYPVIVINICEDARLCHLIFADLGPSVTSNKVGDPNYSILMVSIIIACQYATTVTKTDPNVLVPRPDHLWFDVIFREDQNIHVSWLMIGTNLDISSAGT